MRFKILSLFSLTVQGHHKSWYLEKFLYTERKMGAEIEKKITSGGLYCLICFIVTDVMSLCKQSTVVYFITDCPSPREER